MALRLSLFVFLAVLSLRVHSEKTPKVLREYVVKKDMHSGDKASQFSIYADRAEKNLTFRIESMFSPMQKIDVITYPKKESVGRLDAQQLGTYYEARIELKGVRNASNTWFTGHIKKAFTWFNDNYKISLAERNLLMRSRFTSPRFRFFDEKNKLIAMYKKRRYAFSNQVVYDLKIFSDAFPDPLYMLGIAAYDRQ